MQKILTSVRNLSDAPGVYFFLGLSKRSREGSKREKKILYIGKATSLRGRVRSYFSSDIADIRGPLIVKMLAEATCVTYERTDSVLEALILEAALIKRHQPPYNVREKDNKSWNYVVITDEEYPRVFTLRERELSATTKASNFLKLQAVYGPFPHGAQLQEALKIVRKIFPFRGKRDPARNGERRRSSLNVEIGIAPNFSAITKTDYARTIRNINLFFQGKKKQLLRVLKREMGSAARQREFERAAAIRRQLFALQHIQDVALLKQPIMDNERRTTFKIEGYDVAHISETARVGVMVALENGEPDRSAYRKFKIRTKNAGDIAALAEILERRVAHDEWPLPRLIVVDGGAVQKRAAEKTLSHFGYAIPVVAVTKDERHRPKRILGRRDAIAGSEDVILLANNEAHRFALAYHRRKRRLHI